MKRNIYDIIKELCDENNTNIGQLEKELKFGVSTIHRWKTASPSTDKLSIVADYFNVSLDYLMDRVSSKQTLDEALKDKRIISFQRAMEKMPQEKQEQTMKILAAIDDAFSEDED